MYRHRIRNTFVCDTVRPASVGKSSVVDLGFNTHYGDVASSIKSENVGAIFIDEGLHFRQLIFGAFGHANTIPRTAGEFFTACGPSYVTDWRPSRRLKYTFGRSCRLLVTGFGVWTMSGIPSSPQAPSDEEQEEEENVEEDSQGEESDEYDDHDDADAPPITQPPAPVVNAGDESEEGLDEPDGSEDYDDEEDSVSGVNENGVPMI